MDNPIYEIKITGSGIREELVKALDQIKDSIQCVYEESLDNAKWEDATLFTEIKVVEE